MKLPPPLRPWAPYLSVFGDRFAQALLGMVAPLARTVGSLPLWAPVERGEPEGFDGICNRGDFGHLLASEWLFADVFPREFLRRAADREQLFLRREFRQPKGNRLSFILFDSGPDQLGNPRLVQLALLLVFARRAADGGVPFAWGSLQDPECRLMERVDVEGIQAFLTARTVDFVSEQAEERWGRRLQNLQLADYWVVGLPEKMTWKGDAARIFIGDVEEPEECKVGVRVRGPFGLRKRCLMLPAGPVASRLLRDPFKPEPKRSQSSVTQEDGSLSQPRVVTDDAGNKVFVQITTQRFCFLKIPSSCRPGAKIRRANGQLPPGYGLLGVAINGRNFRLLTRRGRWLYLIPGHVKKTARTYPEKALVIKNFDRFDFAAQNRLMTCCYLGQPASYGHFFVAHGNGNLFRLKKRGDVFTLMPLSRDVIHLQRTRSHVFTAALRGKGKHVVLKVWKNGFQNLRRIPLEKKGIARILFSIDPSGLQAHLSYGIQVDLDSWFLDDGKAAKRVQLSPRFTAEVIFRDLGAYFSFARARALAPNNVPRDIKPYLFVGLDPSRKKVLGFNGALHPMFESEVPISKLALCSVEGAYVLLMEDGRLEIRDRDQLQLVATFARGELL